jgi:hypothetical protein
VTAEAETKRVIEVTTYTIEMYKCRKVIEKCVCFKVSREGEGERRRRKDRSAHTRFNKKRSVKLKNPFLASSRTCIHLSVVVGPHISPYLCLPMSNGYRSASKLSAPEPSKERTSHALVVLLMQANDDSRYP